MSNDLILACQGRASGWERVNKNSLKIYKEQILLALQPEYLGEDCYLVKQSAWVVCKGSVMLSQGARRFLAKAVIAVEIGCFIGAYRVWHNMNTSQGIIISLPMIYMSQR